jgi:zinc transporter 1
MMGVLVHVIGDAINNIGVIIAAAVIWKASYPGRFYADPGVSMGIAFMILLSAIPLVKNSGSILLESVPLGVNLEDVKHDLEKVDGVVSIHELHAWRLSQHKALASAHVLTSSDSLKSFMQQAKLINECLHAYGIHSTTLQPELVEGREEKELEVVEGEVKSVMEGGGKGKEISVEGSAGMKALNVVKKRMARGCQINCGTLCEELTCCG